MTLLLKVEYSAEHRTQIMHDKADFCQVKLDSLLGEKHLKGLTDALYEFERVRQ